MIFIIIAFIITFIIVFINSYDFLYAFLFGLVGAIIGSMLWVIIGPFIGINLPTTEIVTEQELYALSDNSELSGHHYLFSGYVDEEYGYRYVINTEKGKHIEFVSADNVYIEEGNYEPKIVKYTYEWKEDWYILFAINLFAEDDYTKIYIPEGTITNEYNIDLN